MVSSINAFRVVPRSSTAVSRVSEVHSIPGFWLRGGSENAGQGLEHWNCAKICVNVLAMAGSCKRRTKGFGHVIALLFTSSTQPVSVKDISRPKRLDTEFGKNTHGTLSSLLRAFVTERETASLRKSCNQYSKPEIWGNFADLRP